ncbi:hypothetical protein FHS63_006213 [Azospirillum doebereinerae]
MTDVIQPHPFAFPEATLDDLRERLARALARAGNSG